MPTPRSWHTALSTKAIPDYLRPFLRLLALLLHPGEIIEVRLMNRRTPNAPATVFGNGYFNDPLKLVQQLAEFDGRYNAIACTVHPVRRDLLYAARNTFRRPAGWLAHNWDITRRAVLAVRFLPVPGVSQQAALDRAEGCRACLTAQGWPEPVLADSGHSADLLYAIDVGNTGYGFALVQHVLARLDEQFSDDAVQVDMQACDVAHIFPVYGMLTATAEEPVFRSGILHLPEPLLTVDAERLRSFAGWPEETVAIPPVLPVEPPTVVDAHPVSRFVREQCVLEPEAWTPTGVLHEAYQAFCEDQALDAVAAPHFAKALAVRFNLEGLRRKVQGVVVRGIRGVRLRSSL